MAEINTSKKTGKKYAHKLIRVDLTPMVDLGFLLITFFILTTTMQSHTVMKLIVPKESDRTTDVAQSRTITFILERNDSIGYYDRFAKDIKHAGFLRRCWSLTNNNFKILYGITSPNPWSVSPPTKLNN